MKFSKLDLLTLLISLFLFASCENTSTIGLEIDPSSTVQGALVDTLTINSRTILDEPVATGALLRYPLGSLKDPIFGTTEASVALSVALPTAAYPFGTTPVLDSAILVLNYSNEFYGDSTQNFTIDVHQLTSDLSIANNFLSTKSYPYSSQLIGTKTGRLFPTSKFKITDIVLAGKDTLRSVNPQIRIKLDKEFIQNNIVNLTEAQLKTDVIFKSLFKGLHVQINPTATGPGAMVFLDFAGANSNLALYYKKQGTTTTTVDTVSVNFPVGNAGNRVAATVKQNYTGTAIQTQLDNPNQQYAVTYLQPLAGLRNKITFPSLEKFSNNAGKIVINKAELVIDLVTGTETKPFEAAPRLSLYRYDIAEQRTNVPDNNPNGDIRGFQDPFVFGGYFNSLTKQYVFVITSYIQDLMSKKTKDYGTFIAPTPTNEYLVTPSFGSAARVVIGSHTKNPTAGQAGMKLNLYYTKVN